MKISAFHKGNLPEHLYKPDDDGVSTLDNAILRKAGAATRIDYDGSGDDIEYFYRRVRFFQDTSVPTGYYGRWKAAGLGADTLKEMIGRIDDILDQRRS